MADAIPPDARKVVLAAVVPCERCKGTGCDELTVADYEAAGIDIDLDDDDLGTPDHADDCFECNGDGTRTIVTDIEVTREPYYRNLRRAEAADPTYVWEEVQS